jgi:hypothetical protein
MIKKRLTVILLTIALLVSFAGSDSLACDEEQTNTYVTQILFGNNAVSKSSDEKVQMLLASVYLCCEQADNQGQDKISYLKSKRVSGVPSLSAINIRKDQLIECSHSDWKVEYPAIKKIQANRKKVLRNTVNKVFDFGFVNNVFNKNKGKCDDFAALLYYSHILADYLADDPSETEAIVDGKQIPGFSGNPYYIVNGDKPKFSSVDISRAESNTYLYDGLDDYERASRVLAVVGPNTLEDASDESISKIKPKGWKQKYYERISGSQSDALYNRSHILARSMGGKNEVENLVTGTNFMNQKGMKPLEDEIVNYIQRTGNHVLYRVTPIYKGSNSVCSGIQMEAYSIEDSGKGVCFNRYCYNVQPGIKINYYSGDNSLSDTITGANKALPFVVNNPNKNNPDLAFLMNQTLEQLFQDQQGSGAYVSMMNDLNNAANEARDVLNKNENEANKYIAMKKCQYDYFKALKDNVPKLLEKEDFFNKAFK